MDASGHKRRRVTFHFLLGIGLPSVLLGYLAFRGVRNEMVLLERSRIQEHAAVARKITESIDREISALEDLLLDAIPGRQASGGEVRPLESLQRLKSQETLIEEVFSFERGEQIEFPLARLLFLPERERGPAGPGPPPAALLPGQRLEFREHHYQAAAASYQRAFAQASSAELKGEALNAIARVQVKARLFADAIEFYSALARDYGNLPLSGGTPSGLAARLHAGVRR